MTIEPSATTTRMPARTARVSAARVAVLASMVIAAVAIIVLVLGAGAGDYTLHARFIDAGQLVKGDLVEVGGKSIGTVSDLRLTNHNEADVVLKISDGTFRPLHLGTTAQIRTVGLSGVANRFVELSPGLSTAATIPDGGVLSERQTHPIVDLDALLNSLDPPTRRALQHLIRGGSTTLAGQSQAANQALLYLNPAISQGAALAAQVVSDQESLRRLITSSAQVASALDSRQSDLEQSVTAKARTLRALPSRRGALGDAVSRAPAVLHQATGTLRRARRTLGIVRPVLVQAQPVAQPLADVLRALPPFAIRATPLIAQLRGLLPALRTTLTRLPPLARVAVPAVSATTSTLRAALPIVTGIRPYSAEIATGLFNGFGGETSGYYDANGHFARVLVQGGPGSNSGIASLLPIAPAPGLTSFRTHVFARCPGGATEPAADASNPWIPDASTCNPADNLP